MALRTVFKQGCRRLWPMCSETQQNFIKSPKEISTCKSYFSQLAFLTSSKDKHAIDPAFKGNVVFSGDRVPSLSFLTASISSPLIVSVRHYQSVLRPRLHCKGCYFVWRHGRKFVECSDVPSHKQMKKLPTRKVWLEDYSRGDVKVAMKWNRDLARIADRHVDKTVVSHNWLASRIGRDV